MTDWPAIGEPELLRRLALSSDDFTAMMRGFIASVGPREFSDEAYATALGYPWPRPPSSFLLDGEDVEQLAGWDASLTHDRWPLLAFGSNGSPETLNRKFGHLESEQRRLAVLAGDLHDFDVGAAAHPTAYASFPATLFISPGTALRASVLWVTPEQLTALTWTEVSYHLGRLRDIRFEPDVSSAPVVTSALAYSSRWGSHSVDGEVVALAALQATDRSALAFTQEELLDRLACEAIGEGASARDVVSWIIEDFAGAAERIAPLTRAAARPFVSDRWTPYRAS